MKFSDSFFLIMHYTKNKDFLLTFASWSVATPESVRSAMSLILVLGDGVTLGAGVASDPLLQMDSTLRTLLWIAALCSI